MGEAISKESVEDVQAEESQVASTPVEEDEEDGPLEDWTVKELKDECKTLGLSDKGKKAELIERIKEHRCAAVDEEPTAQEVPASDEAPAAEEITAEVEKSSDEETTTEECTAEVPTEEEPMAIDESEAFASNESPEEEANSVTETTEVNKSIVEPESTSAGLDPSSISDLLAKNEQGQLSQQEFFRIFLISVQNSLTTNQRLSDIEKKLEEAEARLEKVEVAGDTLSTVTTEPENQPEVEEAQPREVVKETEADITALVEEAEKLNPTKSRKRSAV